MAELTKKEIAKNIINQIYYQGGAFAEKNNVERCFDWIDAAKCAYIQVENIIKELDYIDENNLDFKITKITQERIRHYTGVLDEIKNQAVITTNTEYNYKEWHKRKTYSDNYESI